ncbi:MAG TPA: galactose oxidase-like domain-containing protein [Blastocatellia bacterium]|nr:galactose oxidase-like domain-containing protein [Blastocatellia bacterium]
MSETFFISGLVREESSGVGLSGLVVRAYDKDLIYDDLMGEAVTDCDGSFRIVSYQGDFGDFFEKRPDIYLRIIVPGSGGHPPREVFNTRNAIRWNAYCLEYFIVEIPSSIACNLPCVDDEPGHHGGSHEHHPGEGCEHNCHKPRKCTPVTHCRDVYLKIERLPAYSPVAPDDAEHDLYRRDCMRNEGHEDTKIPQSEVDRRRLDALVYREYLDPDYTIPKNDPLVPADINEPRAERRIPGTVIFASPGERLFVHVCNADEEPHSLHVHGLTYGIDSDGSWPFGVHDASGRRSDAICPGQTWCYVFDVTEENIGAWPFHDHHMQIAGAADRGLFGGIVVRDPLCPKPDYEVPLFLHRLVPQRGEAAFDSGTMTRGSIFPHTFNADGTYDYQCRFHPMSGVVRVGATGLASVTVNILDGPSRFDPADVTIQRGGTVTWVHAASEPHTVTETGGSGLETYALNGRAFVGNTPTIVAKSGKRIRWYVFDLDLSTTWHNFHVHGQRWQVGDEIVDTRTLGPAESFVADTIVPPVILLPLDEDCHSHKEHRGDKDCGCVKRVGRKNVRLPILVAGATNVVVGHGGGGHQMAPADPTTVTPAKHPGTHAGGGAVDEEKKKTVRLQGDFLVHCHVEMHMMQGMAAVVRATQDVTLTPEIESALGFDLPVPTSDTCPDVPMHPCSHGGAGSWERLPDLPIFVVHSALLRTGKVLLWAGTAEVGDPLESRVWDPGTGTLTTQTYGEDLFCSGHAFLEDGRLCIAGGAPSGTLRSTHIFDPAAETWTKMNNMNEARWYPTVATLPDGRILAASGSGASQLEIYDPFANSWQLVSGAGRVFSELYPSLHLLPSGQVFYSRAGWAQADMVQTRTALLAFSGPLSGTWSDLGQQQFYDRQEGTAVLQIDATVNPPAANLFMIGGGVSGPATARNPQSAEMIELTSTVGAAWTRIADMNFPRTNVNAVLLPDGTILVIGGQRNGKWNPDPGPVLEAEIYDPRANTWTATAPMMFPRQYHSVAVLLPDGRVMTAGGVDPSGVPQRDQRNMEIFSPPYLFFGTRPVITTAPGNVAYGANFDIDTPDTTRVDSVALLRPASVTHHTDAGARYIKVPISSRTASRLTVQAPANGNIAPPGYYLLFIVDSDGVPSEGSFVRLS